MIRKLTILLTVVAISVKGKPENQRHLRHAISLQDIQRGDVPFAYSHNASKEISTTKPRLKHTYGLHATSLTKFYPMQYAPLEKLSAKEQTSIPDSRNKVFQFSVSSTQETTKYEELEPKLVTDGQDSIRQNRPFIPGHNIKIIKSHKPAMYSDPFRTSNNNFLRDRTMTTIEPNEEQLISVSTQSTQTTKIVKPTSPAKVYVSRLTGTRHIANETRPITIIRNLTADKLLLKYQQHQLPAKENRVHLNIARAYGIAQSRQKAPQPRREVGILKVDKPNLKPLFTPYNLNRRKTHFHQLNNENRFPITLLV